MGGDVVWQPQEQVRDRYAEEHGLLKAEREGEFYEQQEMFGEGWVVRHLVWRRTSSASKASYTSCILHPQRWRWGGCWPDRLINRG